MTAAAPKQLRAVVRPDVGCAQPEGRAQTRIAPKPISFRDRQPVYIWVRRTFKARAPVPGRPGAGMTRAGATLRTGLAGPDLGRRRSADPYLDVVGDAAQQGVVPGLLLEQRAGHELGARPVGDQPGDEALPRIPAAEVAVEPEAAALGAEHLPGTDRGGLGRDLRPVTPERCRAFCTIVIGCSSTSRAPACFRTARAARSLRYTHYTVVMPPKTQPFSIRLNQRANRLVEDEARRSGRSRSVVVEELAEEGAKARLHPGIAFRGRPRRAWVIGSGLDVWEIVDLLRAYADDRAALLADHPLLSDRHLRAAQAYASQFTEEVEQLLAENRPSPLDLAELYPFLHQPGS